MSMTLSGVAADDFAADVDDFMISSDGVLSFKFSPKLSRCRHPQSRPGNCQLGMSTMWWWWPPTTRPALSIWTMGYKKVTVMVTDVDEPGMVTLSAQQPQVGVALTGYPDR